MVQKAISVKTMMKFKLLSIFIITILAAASNISFGMEVPKTITIQCKDKPMGLDNIKRTNDNPGLWDILQTSQTIKNMLEDLGNGKELTSDGELIINGPISFAEMPAKNFECAFKYMSLIAHNNLVHNKNKATNNGIYDELQKSELLDLCVGLLGCNYLNVQFKQQETKTKRVEHSFVDKCLMPAIVNKFDYTNENHYECVANKLNELPDHKKVIEEKIIDRLSIGKISCNGDNAEVLYREAFNISLDQLQRSYKHQNLTPITAAAQKGDWYVLGFEDGRVIGCSVASNQINDERIWWCLNDIKDMHDHRVMPHLGGVKVISQYTTVYQLFIGHIIKIESVALHPTKKLLVSADETVVKLWDLNTCLCISIFNKDFYGDFDAATIRFNVAGDKIISGPDANKPVSSWELHDPYEIVKSLNTLKRKLGGKNSFFDKIWKSISDDTISWPQWLWNNKILISGWLVACALLYYKRDVMLPFMRYLFTGKLS